MALTVFSKTSDREFSQMKLEEYARFNKIIAAGRQNPVWFSEYMYGVSLMDYQKWCFMKTWVTPYVLWLACRASGKTSLAAVYLQTKMVLIPDYRVYVSTNSAGQSIEVFKKIEDIAFKRVPSFRTVTDIFKEEVYRGKNNDTGFVHDPAGHHFTTFNNSELITLSTNLKTILGKRGSVLFDETAWQTREQMAAVEHFADVNSEFSLGTEKTTYLMPKAMPLQLLYASSAGDVEYPFYDKYNSFAKKMFMGDKNYYVCDLNVNTVMHYASVNGKKITSHITQSIVDKAIEEDPESAERELFNKFRKGIGLGGVVKMDDLISSSTIRKPLLFNDTGKRQFIFCYDPARSFDGSILAIFELINDNDGFHLELVNMISMVDQRMKKRTPLPMPAQLEIIKKAMMDYNGDRAAEWENIEFYIDAGSGGGGISAVADQLMADWLDSSGVKHRGIIDPIHKQYESARLTYTNAAEIVHLVEPTTFKRIMFDALEKLIKLHLIGFPQYDGHDYLVIDNGSQEFENISLTFEEQVALQQMNLAKTELSCMARYENANGLVTYELAKEKQSKMHDDRAYTIAMGAFALAQKRRLDLLTGEKKDEEAPLFQYRSGRANQQGMRGGNRNRRW